MPWVSCLAFLSAMTLISLYRDGPKAAMGKTLLLSLVFPKWIHIEVGDHAIDLRVAAGAIALVAFCFHPQSILAIRLTVVDFCGIGLVAVNIASDLFNHGSVMIVMAVAFAEWYVPYVLGRAAVRCWDDVTKLVPTACLVYLLLSTIGIYENLSGHNLFEEVFASRHDEGLVWTRQGWNRSFGSTNNPIFFGTLLLLFLPWSMEAAYAATSKHLLSIWQTAPLVLIAGIMSTISRAPILSIPIVILTSLFVRAPKTRSTLIVLSIVCTLFIAVKREAVLEGLHIWSDNASPRSRATIVVEGQSVEYTSALHRVYLWKIYRKAIEETGLLGFGSDRTSVFPPMVPMSGDFDLEAVKRLWCIDNQFLLILLRFGWLGLLSWCSLMVAVVWSYWKISHEASNREKCFWGSMLGTVIAVGLVQMTVWMPHDYGFLFLAYFGMAAGVISTSPSTTNRDAAV